jgi:hypothetical protein
MPLPMPRWRLRTALAGIAVLSLFLAIGVYMQRRRDWCLYMQLKYATQAGRIQQSLIGNQSLSADEAVFRLHRIHWYDAVANRYYGIAHRPWVNFQPDPSRSYCMCKWHQTEPWPSPEPLRVSESNGKAL